MASNSDAASSSAHQQPAYRRWVTEGYDDVSMPPITDEQEYEDGFEEIGPKQEEGAQSLYSCRA